MKFVLKQYDTELLSFDLRSEGLDGFVCTIMTKAEKHRRLFPLGLKLTYHGVLDWLNNQHIRFQINHESGRKFSENKVC